MRDPLRPLDPAAWHADPLQPDAARDLLARVHHHQQQALVQGQACPDCPLLEMIARYWLDRFGSDDFATLLSTLDSERQAMARLVYAQLRLSRKLRGAHQELQAAFQALADRLDPGDYFHVLRRHQILASLRLGDTPAPPQNLESLLTEAAVTAQLAPRQRPGGDPGDTLG